MISKRRRPFALTALPLAVLVSASSALAKVEPEPGFGLPRDVSADGHWIDWLMNVTHVFNIILFAVMCVWIAIACFKHGRRHEAEYDTGDAKRSVVVALSLSAFIFFIVDGNLFVQTIRGLDAAFWNFSIPRDDPKTVRIQINGHQWAWDARYTGPDNKFGTEDDIVTWNEVRVPVDAPVYLQLASVDVIHSFYLPNLRVKIDAVPGQLNRMWFRPVQTGDYDIGCAQHCGTHHYKMSAILKVMPPDEFQRWHQEAATIAKRSYDPDDKAANWAWDWKEI